jgi:hypothetical protein
MRTRRPQRFLAGAIAGLVALALTAPAAHGATKTLHFQDRSIDGPEVNGLSGEIRLDVRYKDRNGNRRFTPRAVTLYWIETLPVSCQQGGQQFMTAFGPNDPIKLSRRRFVHDFAEEGFQGGLSGKVTKLKWRIAGRINVLDVDFEPTASGCTTNGPRAYSATRCRTPNQDQRLPVCRVGGGS